MSASWAVPVVDVHPLPLHLTTAGLFSAAHLSQGEVMEGLRQKYEPT